MNEFLDYIRSLNPNYELEGIKKAYELAAKMHDGQLRKSGEPYIIHPVEVAKILASLGMDEQTIIAGLLHDVVEDTEYTEEQLKEDFGEEVTLLVDGVTKLGNLVFETKEDAQAENLRKMFLAMSKDIRVLIIKLADRLHNMRTINYMSPAEDRGKIKRNSRNLRAARKSSGNVRYQIRTGGHRSEAAPSGFLQRTVPTDQSEKRAARGDISIKSSRNCRKPSTH